MLCYLLFLSFLLAVSPVQTDPNCGCEDTPQINVLAVVNGIKITKQDLSIDTRTQVSLVQETVIVARSQAVNQLINKTLLEAEAKRRGLTAAQLLELEVTAKIAQPTEEEARNFYNLNKTRTSQDFKSVKNDLLGRLRSERETTRAREFANALRVAAKVTVSEQPVTAPTNEADLSRVFATINGVDITSRDLEESLRPLIFRVQQQVYALRKRDVDLKINDLLLEQEAKRLGATPQELINQNVRSKVSIITDEQARAFYKEHKTSFKGDFDEVKFQIMQYLLEQEQQKLFMAYAEQLRKGAAVQIYLREPASPKS
jgi:hypothetical protein